MTDEQKFHAATNGDGFAGGGKNQAKVVSKVWGLCLVCMRLAFLYGIRRMDRIFNFCHWSGHLIAEGTTLDAEKIFGGLPQDAGNFFNFNPYNLLAGLVFGTIGWGAYSYGKRLELWQPRAIGVVMMVYPYLFTNAWLLWGVGVALMVVLWFYHHE